MDTAPYVLFGAGVWRNPFKFKPKRQHYCSGYKNWEKRILTSFVSDICTDIV